MLTLLYQTELRKTRLLFLFKKSLRNLRAHLCITPVIRALFTVFSKTIFEKTAELCSGKGAALSLPLAAIPQKTNEKQRVYNAAPNSRAASQDQHILMTPARFFFSKKWVKSKNIVE